MILRPPTSTLFPYTTLSRSRTSSRWKTHLGRVAVAASVTVAVLVGVRMVNHDPAVISQMASVEHGVPATSARSEEHTSELQSRPHLVCRLLLEKKKTKRMMK